MPTLEGTIERIVFRNEQTHYTVARLRPNDTGRLFRSELVTLVGTLPGVSVGEPVDVTGEWEAHPQHGRHLRVLSFTRHAPVTPEGLKRYLGSGVIKGIGPKTAERIVEHFGEQTLAVLELEPERLTEVKGVSAHKRATIVRGWAEQQDIREIMLFLQSHGVSPGLGAKIYRQYGDKSISVIQENPYRLEQDVNGVGFKTADALAVELGLPRDSLPRLMTGIKHTLSSAAGDGHCYLLCEDLLTRAAALLLVAPEALPPALEALRTEREVFVEEDRVYLAPFFYAESGTARRLRMLLRGPSALPAVAEIEWEAAFSALERDRKLHLAERQRAAVKQAYHAKVSILTGGPGTGKTTTVRALLDVLDGRGVAYALAAPTGRAAKRLAEATGRPAKTLHRLLEFIPNSTEFAYNEDRPLPYPFVVLDEISMLDVLLAYRLVKALAPETHLLLVGDADQLPSVGPGSVLHDLLQSGAIPHTRLTELFRQAQASAIVVNAHRVNAGEMPELRSDPRGDFFFLRADDPLRAQQLVVDLVARRLPARYALDPLRDIQVLAPMYRGPVGVQALNEALQARLNPDPAATLAGNGRTLGLGDKVMQIRNNYDKGTFNGDVGRVVRVDREEGEFIVEFPEEGGPTRVAYEPHELDELTLAYCISIHRAQGSEYPCVVLPLLPQHYQLLQRNLLYTAITRAKRLCVIVGDPRALRRAVTNDTLATRNTGLSERLGGPSPRRSTAPAEPGEPVAQESAADLA
ncbi:MAG: ATP-dependent RecD-like DNA helicase [Ktedonobacterales bacterium]